MRRYLLGLVLACSLPAFMFACCIAQAQQVSQETRTATPTVTQTATLAVGRLCGTKHQDLVCLPLKNKWQTYLTLHQVDGKKPEEFAGAQPKETVDFLKKKSVNRTTPGDLTIPIDAGEHSITASYYASSYVYGGPGIIGGALSGIPEIERSNSLTVSFVADPGHIYSVHGHFFRVERHFEWTLIVVDETTKQIFRSDKTVKVH